MPLTKQPLVSVIIPTYNHGRFIAGAVGSAMAQTYGNTEIIVIDNYSEDDTEKIVASFESPKIKYIKFRNNGIIAASRNEGARLSSGEYIAFLDSDDLWEVDKLEKQLPYLLENPGLAGVASDMKIDSDMGYKDSQFGSSPQGFRDYGYKQMIYFNPIATSSAVVRKKDFTDAGRFDESADFRFIEDWELWLRIAQKGRFRVLGDKLITYRIYPTTRDKTEVTKRKLKVLDKQAGVGILEQGDIDEARVVVLRILGFQLFLSDNRGSAASFWEAYILTRSYKVKIIVMAGFFMSFLPLFIRKFIFGVLGKFNKG